MGNMKLIPIVNELITEGLNLPKKQPVIYQYQTKCYHNGDPHGGHDIYNDDECLWAQALHDDLNEILEAIPNYFDITDIRLFDKYQGPYAMIRISGKPYKIWTISDAGFMGLFISNYPIDNTSMFDDVSPPGFRGRTDEIVDVILNPGNYLQTQNN